MNLRKLIAGLNRRQGGWQKLLRELKRGHPSHAHGINTRIREIHGFGSNPGNLRMFSYVPPNLATNPAAVVVLHGCTQTAGSYDIGAGWSTLADRYGFALILPEQQRTNNPNGCFNWFQPEDTRRDCGEALSIRQMVEKLVLDKGIDRGRVFVTGLSAGGAMTSVMLACYPEVFAGGAIVAGLPFGAATNVKQAFQSMFQSPARPAREWGDLVRRASGHTGPWPRVSVWHGNADKTVIPLNARQILQQWTAVHGLPLSPSKQETIDGYPREVWIDEAGIEMIESYTVTNMAHGTPLATGKVEGACGSAGPFLLEVGISSSYHIAKFFGIAGTELRQSAESKALTLSPATIRSREDSAAGSVLEGEVLDNDYDTRPNQGITPPPAFEIGAVINNALRSAGLIKG